jgi:hypothetical protein
MERLSYIDDIAITVATGREQTWTALRSVLRSDLSGGAATPLIRALGAAPAHASGDWSGDLRGAALPGFAVAQSDPHERLELNGRHRFARYALTFELEDAGAGSTRLHARTHAEFPGLRGTVYRALVIGTRAHRVVVQRLLRRVARRAVT